MDGISGVNGISGFSNASNPLQHILALLNNALEYLQKHGWSETDQITAAQKELAAAEEALAAYAKQNPNDPQLKAAYQAYNEVNDFVQVDVILANNQSWRPETAPADAISKDQLIAKMLNVIQNDLAKFPNIPLTSSDPQNHPGPPPSSFLLYAMQACDSYFLQGDLGNEWRQNVSSATQLFNLLNGWPDPTLTEQLAGLNIAVGVVQGMDSGGAIDPNSPTAAAYVTEAAAAAWIGLQ